MSTPTWRPPADDDSAKGDLSTTCRPGEADTSSAGAPAAGGSGPACLDIPRAYYTSTMLYAMRDGRPNAAYAAACLAAHFAKLDAAVEEASHVGRL
jgi:hypothetical protein